MVVALRLFLSILRMCIDLQRVLTGSRDADVTEPSSDDIEFNSGVYSGCGIVVILAQTS